MKARCFAAFLFFLLLSSIVPAKAEEGVSALFAATMIDTHGQPMALTRFRGQPLILNFWARWCTPCREEIPELSALQTEYAGRGLRVLGIALENDPEKVREFLAVYGANYPVALAREKGLPLMRAFGNDAGLLPFTLLIDRDGNVLLRKYGVFGKKDFSGMAEKLLR